MKKRAAFLVGTGFVLLAASAFLAVNNYIEGANAAISAKVLAEAYLSRASVYEAPVIEAASGTVQIETIDVNENRSAVEQMPVKQPIVVDGQEYIGLLSIPSLGVNLPVNNDISYPLLKRSPCRYFGSAEEGPLVIAAHNYDSHFGKIGTLQPGDTVNISGADGKSERYIVSEVLTLSSDDVDEMIKPGGWDLTLFTCTYSGTERITVRCEKEDRL